MDGQYKSFLQSDMWVEFHRSLGRKVFDVGDTKVIKHDLPFGKSYLYVPYAQSISDLRELAKQENSIFIKAEPLQDDIAQQLVRIGYQKSSKNIQPHKTVVLDLTQSEEELLGAMHHKTRYNIRVAEKNGVVIREEKNIDIFWNLMQKTIARDQFSSHSKEYYEKLLKLCELHVAYKNQTPLAAAMILKYGHTSYYLHGASDHEYRALMAPCMLHWSIMTKLQASNIKSYDFWGIDAQRWPGVTRFKLGWGGRTIEYPGAFDLPISKPWYGMYTTLTRIRAMLK